MHHKSSVHQQLVVHLCLSVVNRNYRTFSCKETPLQSVESGGDMLYTDWVEYCGLYDVK